MEWIGTLTKAVAVMAAILGLIYASMWGCRTALQPHFPDAGQKEIIVPDSAQGAIPKRWGNDPAQAAQNPVDLSECHTQDLAGDIPAFRMRVIRVIDGDTIEAQTTHQPSEIIRLWGIDAPEMEQEYGSQAKARLESMLPEGTLIQGRDAGTDVYGRVLTVLGENHQVAINADMVLHGWAHHYDRYESKGNRCLRENAKAIDAIAGWNLGQRRQTHAAMGMAAGATASVG